MILDCRQYLDYIGSEICRQTDFAVVGLSGGADSSLTAILCREALGTEAVYGISMPYDDVDRQTFNARSARLARTIGIRHLIRPIGAIADAINDQVFVNPADELTTLNKGNARSRARMCVLYGVAHTLSGRFPSKRIRVIGTGNLSEDFIGYDTKGGDALADFFPIGELFKSEVYQLLDHFKAQGLIDEDLIDRTPSAGLEANQTDEGDLGYTYAEMETAIRFCRAHYTDMPDQPEPAVTAFVWQRHLAHKHKHEAPVVIRSRHLCD
jgi:NAD+ synthase